MSSFLWICARRVGACPWKILDLLHILGLPSEHLTKISLAGHLACGVGATKLDQALMASLSASTMFFFEYNGNLVRSCLVAETSL